MQHTVDLRKKKQDQKSSDEVKILKSKKAVQSPTGVDQPHNISWQAPSFYYNPQKRYLSMVIVGLLFVGAGAVLFFRKDTLTAIFLALCSLVLILYATKKPEVKEIVIDDDGVHVGENSFLYQELKSFWIDYTPRQDKELSLEAKKWYLPYVKVSIENKNPIEIRSWLVSFLPEKEHEASIVDIIGKKIGL